MRSHWKNRTIVKQCTAPILAAAALFVACERDRELTPTASPTADLVQMPAEVQELLKLQLERFSTMPMLLTADFLGLTEIQGKPTKPQTQDTRGSPKRLIDVPIANTTADENEPSVATSTKDKKLVVVGNHRITGTVRCEARHSSDGGMSWSAPVTMPQLTPTSQCSDPVLAWSPDGSTVYYAYMDIKFFTGPPFFDFDIIVSRSTDDGATWSAPVVALDGLAGVFIYDKPWIGMADDAANFVYVTATRFDQTGVGFCQIAFTRSTDAGASYAAPTTLDMSTAGCGVGPSPIVQGSRPSGGKNGNVLVAWYNSGTDGWLTGSFQIRTRHSADNGATFDPIVIAATDAFEAPFFLGPNICYERWWPVMFPDVEIDASGSAHVGYTHDPTADHWTAEEGDIRYVTSTGAPYTSWSAPITVNDDGTVSAQGFLALDTQTEQTGQSARLHATWLDHRLSASSGAASQCPFTVDVNNLLYDIFYSTKPPGEGWSANNRVTDASSRSDFFFLGDYIDLSTDNGSLYTVWTDRRDKLSIFDLEDDVWGSRTHQIQ
ncbi:MAG: exo-alpha-sialidase [Candidatus Eisenbacteria bacterium]|uniref:Exo-alpha-sialidase n=1 Tax=Eiseniibacteriota bacterium TaxID=2212470 RepID=A0A538ST46_UNCEI|nr:MAG: exo-alpha-sialidase [Candidatus Eisenbacteria bacterium]